MRLEPRARHRPTQLRLSTNAGDRPAVLDPEPSASVQRHLIELHRRTARRFWNRENHRLRTLLIAGGFTSPHTKGDEPGIPYQAFRLLGIRRSHQS